MPQDVFANDTLFTGNVTMAGTGSFPPSSVSTTALISNSVTATKLTTTLATGFIPLALATAREISAADTINTAGDAGVLSLNTTPILHRVNAGTDKQFEINWVAGNADEIQWSVMSPPDLDSSQPVLVKIQAKMSGATNTPTITVAFWEGVGGSNLGGATAALSSTLATVSVSCTVTAVAGTPKPWSITLIPGVHGTDAVQMVGVWLEYTRK